MGNEQSSPETRRRRQNEERNNRNTQIEVERALAAQRKQFEKRVQDLLKNKTAASVPQQPATNVASAGSVRPNNNTRSPANQTQRVPSTVAPQRPPPPLINPSNSDGLSERQRHPYSYTNQSLAGAVKNTNSLYPNLGSNVSTTAVNNSLSHQGRFNADNGAEYVMVNNFGQHASFSDTSNNNRCNPKPAMRHQTSAPSTPSAPPMPRSASASRSRSRNDEDEICCPTCNSRFGVKIFNCSSGHAACLDCKIKSRPCGRCGHSITDIRNITMEEYVLERKVPCPHEEDGCCLSFKIGEIEQHLTECPYKETQCLLPGGKCKWKGKLSRMLQHFDNFHPDYRQSDVDTELFLHNICLDNWIMQLIKIGTFTFVFHLQVSEADSKIYIAVQLLGTQVSANKWNYEIHVYNKRQPRRKYQFTDKCISIGEPIEDIVRDGSCAVLPMSYAKTFVNDGALAYKFYIKKNDVKDNDEKRDASCNRRGGRGGRGGRGRGNRNY